MKRQTVVIGLKSGARLRLLETDAAGLVSDFNRSTQGMNGRPVLRSLPDRRGKSVVHIVDAVLARAALPRPKPAPVLVWVDEACRLSPELSTWLAARSGTRRVG